MEFAIESLVILGLVSGIISFSLTRAVIFSWLRNGVSNFLDLIDNDLADYVDHFMECYYCVSHWVAFFAVCLAFQFDLTFLFIVQWFSVAAIAVLFCSIIDYFMNSVVE